MLRKPNLREWYLWPSATPGINKVKKHLKSVLDYNLYFNGIPTIFSTGEGKHLFHRSQFVFIMGFIDNKELFQQDYLHTVWDYSFAVISVCVVSLSRHGRAAGDGWEPGPGLELGVCHWHPRHLLPGNLCRLLREGPRPQNRMYKSPCQTEEELERIHLISI